MHIRIKALDHLLVVDHRPIHQKDRDRDHTRAEEYNSMSYLGGVHQTGPRPLCGYRQHTFMCHIHHVKQTPEQRKLDFLKSESESGTKETLIPKLYLRYG